MQGLLVSGLLAACDPRAPGTRPPAVTTDPGPLDHDGDGTAVGEDCDDLDPLRFPGNRELLCDPVDGDCDGDVERGADCAFDVADAALLLATDGAPRIGGDLTGDLRPDLVTLDATRERDDIATTELRVWAQTDDGVARAATVWATVPVESGWSTWTGIGSSFPAGDADGDGDEDWWLTPEGSSTTWLLAGPFAGDVAHDAVGVFAMSGFVRAGDANGDGIGDAVGEGLQHGPFDGAGPRAEVPLEGGGIATAVADLDGDGVPEVVGPTRDAVGAWDGASGAEVQRWAVDYGWYVESADTNGDGHADLALLGQVFFGPAIDLATADVVLDGVDSAFEPCAIGDLDGDGADELTVSAPDATWVVHASAPGTFAMDDVSYEVAGASPSIGPWDTTAPVLAVEVSVGTLIFGPSTWPVLP